MNAVQKAALAYIGALLLLTYGYAIGRFKVFPHDYLESLVADYLAFVAGDQMEVASTPLEKLQNDVGLSFERIIYEYPEAARKGQETAIPNQGSGRDAPLIYVNPNHQEGYRSIVGAFDFEDSLWGAVLLDGSGEPLHHWNLSTSHLPGNQVGDNLKNLYPAHIFPDGSVIFNMAATGGGIVKVDACGEILWNLEGAFHHTIQPDEDGTFWTFIGYQYEWDQNIAQVSIETGEIIRRINMADVRAANPDLFIWYFQLRIFDWAKARDKGNMSHANDIDPLPAALAEDFPMFEAGDLVISYAMTNNIFVLDPETLEVKWWRIGLTDLQHDPDWEPGGMIVIYSNNSRTKMTTDIVAADPRTLSKTIVFDGAEWGVLSRINGDHQLTPYGTRIITSSTQGWVFEIDEQGEVVFNFTNNIDTEEGRALHLSRATRYSEDFFTEPFWETCR